MAGVFLGIQSRRLQLQHFNRLGGINSRRNALCCRGESGLPIHRRSKQTSHDSVGKYDFLLASHCLEHMANPSCAFQEWLRVLKKKGVIFLVLPDKGGTFDDRRPVTAFSHLVRDLEMQTPEDDFTHLEEILTLHDLALDPPAGNCAPLERRSRANFQNRCLHPAIRVLPVEKETTVWLSDHRRQGLACDVELD